MNFLGFQLLYLQVWKFLVPILKPFPTNDFTGKDYFYFGEETFDQQLDHLWLA